MSWITRCPDCDTVYKVSSEKLQQAHGWLRCGGCQHVFDSAGRVVAADVIPTLTDRVNVGAPQLGRVDLERLLHKESPDPRVAEPAMPPAAQAPAAPAWAEPPRAPSGAAPLSPVAESSPLAEPSPLAAFEEALHSFQMPDLPVRPDAVATESANSQVARPVKVATHAPSRRMAWLAWLLALLLCLQLALLERTQLLRHWPQLGLMALEWCQSAACRVRWQPPLSLWRLEASTMALDGAGYRVTWSVAHVADVRLPVPDLVLDLRNLAGQVVSSQRLSAALTGAPPELMHRQIWQGSVHVDVAPELEVAQAQLRLTAQ